MGLVDWIWLIAILVGSGWLLYRFLWKNKGHCHNGCTGQCSDKKHGQLVGKKSLY